MTEPAHGDYLIELVGDSHRLFEVRRHDIGDAQTFPTEAGAMKYAVERALFFGFRVFRWTEEGWMLVSQD